MALIISSLPRIFKYAEKRNSPIILEDPNAKLTPEQVLNFYAHQYPKLTTATIIGPEIINDSIEYSFSPQMGTKG